MTKRCLVCSREFHIESTQCATCKLPLYNTAETAHIQIIELGTIIRILMQRHENVVRSLREPVIRRPVKAGGILTRWLSVILM